MIAMAGRRDERGDGEARQSGHGQHIAVWAMGAAVGVFFRKPAGLRVFSAS